MKSQLLRSGIYLILALAASFTPKLDAQPRIVGGSDAIHGFYPWMTAIVFRGTTDLRARQFCGGSLIDEYWVLSAAHCFEDRTASEIEVWVNITDLSNPEPSAVQRNVREIYIHPDYGRDNDGNLVNDMAYLLLEAPVAGITPAGVAQSPNTASSGELVTAIGWGDTESDPAFPDVLQVVALRIDPISLANARYSTNQLDDRHIAASEIGADTCQGDSGGPLFTGASLNPVIVGITSFGIGCADGFPGIYANSGNYATLTNSFLASPTGPDAGISVQGNSGTLANGASPSRSQGTNFGKRVRGGKRKNLSMSVSNSPGAIPLSITSVTTRGSRFRVRGIPPTIIFGGTTVPLTVQFRAPRSSRTSRSTLRMLTNDPNQPAFTFRLLGKSKFRKKPGGLFSVAD
ncbi:MAG: serine protease [Verrucomicrobiota bacterium]